MPRGSAWILLLLALAGGYFWFLTGNLAGPGEPAPVAPTEPGTPPTEVPTVEEANPPAGEDRPTTNAPVRVAEAAPLGPRALGPDVLVLGDAYIDQPGASPRPVVSGTLNLTLLTPNGPDVREVEVDREGFRVVVPTRCRLRFDGGELDGSRVTFRVPRGPIDLPDRRLALIGVPVPEITVVATDQGSGGALPGIRVWLADDESTVGPDPEAPPLAEGPPPLTLPWIDGEQFVRLHVGAEGYARRSALINPRQARALEVRLAPLAGTVTVRLRGSRAKDVDHLILQRWGDKDRSAAGRMARAEATELADGLAWEVEGLGAGPHRIRAILLDAQFTPVTVAEHTVDLGAGLSSTVELRARPGGQ